MELPVIDFRERKPPWLKVRAPGGPNYLRLKRLMRDANLHSVCEEAHCPNIGECWEDATATFMILGDVCTRNCGYCAIAHGRPTWEDREEPERVGRAIGDLGLEYVVITSVNRDDLADGGAAHWAATVRAVRRHAPRCRVEVLIPDFQGDAAALQTVIDAGPNILNHNTETVPRLYRLARHGGRYERTLELFRRARATAPGLPTKSRLHPHAGPVPAPVRAAPAGGALLPAGGVRRAGRGGAGARLHARRGRPARPLLIPRQTTGGQRRNECRGSGATRLYGCRASGATPIENRPPTA